MKNIFRLLTLLFCLVSTMALAQQGKTTKPFVDAARGPTPITESTKPPALGNEINNDLRQTRNYPMQPPVIPHRVRRLSGRRSRTSTSVWTCHKPAPRQRYRKPTDQHHPLHGPRWPTLLGQISTRRYFCSNAMCRRMWTAAGAQHEFQDIDTVILNSQKKLKK